MPASTAAAATGTMLVDIALASDWAGAATNGTKALNGLPLSTTSLGNGTCGYYRFVDTAGTTSHEQGTVTVTGGGGDLTVDNPTLASGQTLNITAFAKTEAGQ